MARGVSELITFPSLLYISLYLAFLVFVDFVAPSLLVYPHRSSLLESSSSLCSSQFACMILFPKAKEAQQAAPRHAYALPHLNPEKQQHRHQFFLSSDLPQPSRPHQHVLKIDLLQARAEDALSFSKVKTSNRIEAIDLDVGLGG